MGYSPWGSQSQTQQSDFAHPHMSGQDKNGWIWGGRHFGLTSSRNRDLTCGEAWMCKTVDRTLCDRRASTPRPTALAPAFCFTKLSTFKCRTHSPAGVPRVSPSSKHLPISQYGSKQQCYMRITWLSSNYFLKIIFKLLLLLTHFSHVNSQALAAY